MLSYVRQGLLADTQHRAAGRAQHDPVRRTPRHPQAGGGRGSVGPERIYARHLLSHRRHHCQQLGPGPGRGNRRTFGHGSRFTGGGNPAGAGAEHQTLPLLRAQLRVFFRGPLFGRQDGSQLRARHPEEWRVRLPEAFRRQFPGAAPDGVGLRHGRADPAGDLPDWV